MTYSLDVITPDSRYNVGKYEAPVYLCCNVHRKIMTPYRTITGSRDIVISDRVRVGPDKMGSSSNSYPSYERIIHPLSKEKMRVKVICEPVTQIL